jgi:N4-gp56 family major capsid protein
MATNVYGNGTTTATAGANTIVHYYDKAGVKAANEVNVYGQWADRKSMPKKMGKTFKISKFLHIYDRELTDGDFASKGYLTARDIADVSAGLTATDGSGASLTEGAGATNKRSIKKITMETSVSRYGEMLDYTDEVDLFSEDMMQVHYREELGRLANRRMEDLIQLDMLGTTNVMYVGTAAGLAEVGQDTTAADGSEDDLSRVSYDLIRKGSRKLVRNRAEKNTTIVTGSTKIDTRTINKAFYAIIGPEIKYDLDNLTRGTGNAEEFAYIPAYKYAGAANLAEGEVGAMHDVRFIESESAVVYAAAGAAIPGSYVGTLANDGSNFDVFPILFPTKGAFATVGLKGQGKIKFNSQAPSKIELSNPYGTMGFFSYNFWYAGIVLQEERLLKMLVCASA